MANHDDTNAILAGISGLTQGIFEGLKLRQERDKATETNLLKLREIDIKEKSEASKTEYYKFQREHIAGMDEVRKQLMGTQREAARAGVKLKQSAASLDTTQEATKIDKQITNITEKRAAAERRLSYLKKPEQRAPFEKEVNSYNTQLSDLSARKLRLEAVSPQSTQLSAEFSSASSTEDVIAIANRLQIKNPGMSTESIKAAARQRLKDLQIEGLFKVPSRIAPEADTSSVLDEE